MTKPTGKPRGRSAATRHGNGAGLGGPAKRTASSQAEKAAPFEPGNRVGAVPNDQRDFSVDERKKQMLGIYIEVATDPSQPGMARISAADKWLDRIEGKPIARNLNVNTDDISALAEPDIDAELARIEGAAAEAAAREASTSVPPGLGKLVH